VREVAVLRTLGFTSSQALALILEEAAIIASIGGAIGLLLASGLCAAVRHGPLSIEILRQLRVEPGVALIAFSLAVLVGLLSCFLPARHASRLSIVEAMRHTG